MSTTKPVFQRRDWCEPRLQRRCASALLIKALHTSWNIYKVSIILQLDPPQSSIYEIRIANHHSKVNHQTPTLKRQLYQLTVLVLGNKLHVVDNGERMKSVKRSILQENFEWYSMVD